jgi:hypothetical protein
MGGRRQTAKCNGPATSNQPPAAPNGSELTPDIRGFVTKLSHRRSLPDVQPYMKHDLSEIVKSTPAHASLTVGSDRWLLYIFGVTRVGRDTFMQLALIGPRVCTVTVRAPAPIGNPLTARRVLEVIRDWLLCHDDADQAYLELSDVEELAS